jgi:ABC-type iron transport system FetAB ATPase subunit
MSEHMTAQEEHPTEADMAIVNAAVARIAEIITEIVPIIRLIRSVASIPHVLTLDEASALEPHTAVWLEYRVSSILTEAGWRSLCWLHYAEAAVKRCAMRNRVSDYKPAARIWIGAWPSEELRAATPWEG